MADFMVIVNVRAPNWHQATNNRFADPTIISVAWTILRHIDIKLQ